MSEFLGSAFIYLLAAVIAVPLAKRLGLGSVLGYLIAGVFIGPVLGLVGAETAELQHFAEFGIVMMLFLVGLELEPQALWGMRNKLLGLGGLQVMLTTLLVAAVAIALGQDWRMGFILGMIVSISSTTIVLQTFQELGVGNTAGGRSAFAVLLFQDIVVIPMLAIIPLLALPELVAAGAGAAGQSHSGGEPTLVQNLSGWSYALVVIASISFVILAGHYLSRPLFRFIASTGLREAFTAAALTLMVGVATLMMQVGLSPALGAFLAGVVLASSEFRHELETEIEPFKGLLVGLFFITVGAGIQFSVLLDQLGLIIALTLGAMLLKSAVLLLLALVFGIRGSDGWLFTLSLPQMSAFGFVLLAYSVQNQALPAAMVPVLSVVVALSMFLTPLCFILFQRVLAPRYQDRQEARDADIIDEQGPVIIAGIGRFGQIVNRMLRASGVRTVVLDRAAGQIETMRRIRIKSYFGDATRLDLLRSAGIEQACMLVVAIDDPEQALLMVREVRSRYPQLRILARAYDRGHLYRLCEAGADWSVMETYHSALALGAEALKRNGVHPFKAERYRHAFEAAEQQARQQLYEVWSAGSEGDRFNNNFHELFIELEGVLTEVMQRDREDGRSRLERGWTPPPKTASAGTEQQADV